MQSIFAHFTRLADFSGRESRSAFWPYVACVIALFMLGSMVTVAPIMAGMMVQMEQYGVEHPGTVTTTVGPTTYAVQVDAGNQGAMPDMSAFFTAMEIWLAVVIGLLAAAVTRRLHDSNLRGWWGLLPVPFLVTGFVCMPIIFRQFNESADPDLRLFGLMFANNLAYMAALVGLILLLTRANTPGPNRFGPETGGAIG